MRVPLRIPNATARFEAMAARAMAALPPMAQVGLAGGRPIEIDGQVLEPEIQLLLAAARRRGTQPFHELSVAEARASFRSRVMLSSGDPPEVGDVRDIEVGGGAGRMPARHYAPHERSSPSPIVLYLHGGGFVVGDLDTHDVACRLLCRDAKVHVLAIQYRLAPEHPFPAAVDDAYHALEWTQANARDLGGHADCVAVVGDSSGATLAAVSTWMRVRNGGSQPALLVLLYPGADRTREYRSHALFAEGFGLETRDVAWFDDQYLGSRDRRDPRASPRCAQDLSGMPPSLIVSAGFDPLRDEAEAYAEALQTAGNDVTVRRYSGLIHGFVGLVGISPACRRAVQEVAETIRSILAEPRERASSA